MADVDRKKDDPRSKAISGIGAGVVVGAAIETGRFAVISQPFWIGLRAASASPSASG